MDGKNRKVAAGAVAAVLAVVVVAALAIWQPWAECNEPPSAEQAAPGNVDGAPGDLADTSDEAQEGGGEAGGATDSEWKTIPADYDPDADKWPGAALGFVAPGGEGSVDLSEAEDVGAMDALAASVGYGEENDHPAVKQVSMETANGVCHYLDRMISIETAPGVSEYEAHVLVEKRGGIWIRDDYAFVDFASEGASADVYFPDVVGSENLLKVAKELEAFPQFDVATFKLPEIRSSSSSGQYYLDRCGFSNAWKEVTCSGNVNIAVIDDGFDLDHEDLSGNLVSAWDATVLLPLLADTSEDGGHGTAVAGIASAEAGNPFGIDGASYNAGLILIRHTDNAGEQYWRYTFNALSELDKPLNAPEVINMSFEGQSVSEPYNRLIKAHIANLRNEYGTVIVAAAGNWRKGETDADGNLVEPTPNTVKYPAAYEGVISVGSTDSKSVIAWDSNRNAFVDMCAPGVDIFTTTNAHAPELAGQSYGNATGTSFAAPQVAAAAALLKAQHPEWGPDQIEEQLENTARDLGVAGRDNVYGYGLLNAAAAVGWAPSPTSPVTGGSAWDMWQERDGSSGEGQGQ